MLIGSIDVDDAVNEALFRSDRELTRTELDAGISRDFF